MRKLFKIWISFSLLIGVSSGAEAQVEDEMVIHKVECIQVGDDAYINLVRPAKEHNATVALISGTGTFSTWEAPFSIVEHPARIFATVVACVNDLGEGQQEALLKAAHMLLDPTLESFEQAVPQRSVEGYAAFGIKLTGHPREQEIREYLKAHDLKEQHDGHNLNIYTNFRHTWRVNSMERIIRKKSMKTVAANWGEQLSSLEDEGIPTIFWERYPAEVAEENDFFDLYQQIREEVVYPKAGMEPGEHVHPNLVEELRGRIEGGKFVEDPIGNLFVKNGFVAVRSPRIFQQILALRGIDLKDETVMRVDYHDQAKKKTGAVDAKETIYMDLYEALEITESVALRPEQEFECLKELMKIRKGGSTPAGREQIVRDLVTQIHALPVSLIEKKGKMDAFSETFTRLKERVFRPELLEYLGVE